MTSPKYSERLQKVWDELGLSDEVLEELADSSCTTGYDSFFRETTTRRASNGSLTAGTTRRSGAPSGRRSFLQRRRMPLQSGTMCLT